MSLRKKQERFVDLSPQEKRSVQAFFNAKINQIDKAQKLICRESSIQVVLQLTLIVYQANFNESEVQILNIGRVQIFRNRDFLPLKIFYPSDRTSAVSSIEGLCKFLKTALNINYKHLNM